MAKKTLSQKSQILHDSHEFNVNMDTREVFLTSVISNSDDEAGIDWRMSNNLLKNLRALESDSNLPITIHLQSPGGDLNYSFAMYDMIKSCQSHILIIGHGLVDSGGTIIMQAADNRVLMPNCEFMIHYGSIAVYGNVTEATSCLEWDKRLRSRLVDIYSERCMNSPKFSKGNMNVEQVKSYLRDILKEKQDWYMDSNEAVEYGFADGVIGSPGFENMKVLLDV